MNSQKIDIIESAMKNSYNAKDNHYEISSAWKSSVMNSIREESDNNFAIEKRVVYFSWIAAGIAAIFLLASTIWIYNVDLGSIDNDIQDLYADNSVNEILMDTFK